MAETPKEFDRTKAEYIDRRQIRYTWWQKQDGTFTDGVTLQSVIDDMPTADVVPVVRCKDCKHYTNIDTYRNPPRLDFHWCNKLGNVTKEKDYCSYGERGCRQ